MKRRQARFCGIQVLMLSALVLPLVSIAGAEGGTSNALPLPQPMFSDAQLISTSVTPPSEAQCFSVGRRCFTAAALETSYNLLPLYQAGNQGQGVTIAIIDSYGSDTIANDLNVYSTQMGLPHLCGEAGVTCASGMPTFTQLALQGSPATKAAPPTSKNTGIEGNKASWAVEVSLDVEMAHAMAPMANILLVTTPMAETLGVQGFPQIMAAEDYVVEHQLAQVISQSFGAAEETFGSVRSLLNLRYAFVDAAAAGVTVLASSGDNGSANVTKTPVKSGAQQSGTLIPFPTVGWPASDPLVTGVGGTYLCTNPVTGTGIDNADPPASCQNSPAVREIGWIDAGGGFSHVFAKPAYQVTLPAGSTAIGAMRGVPDVASEASARTGPLVYVTLPPLGSGGLCASCTTGWYVIGGTSVAAPTWAGLVAIAAQIAGHGLGQISPTLYKLAAGPNYGTYFYDVTTGNNQAFPTVPGYPATTGWDPVTGLGTPNAAALLPALAAQ